MIIDWNKNISKVIAENNTDALNDIESEFKNIPDLLLKQESIIIRFIDGLRIEIEPTLDFGRTMDIKTVSKDFNTRLKFNTLSKQQEDVKNQLLEASKDKPELTEMLNKYFEANEFLDGYLYRVNLVKTTDNNSKCLKTLDIPISSIQSYILGLLNSIGVILPNIPFEELLSKVEKG